MIQEIERTGITGVVYTKAVAFERFLKEVSAEDPRQEISSMQRDEEGFKLLAARLEWHIPRGLRLLLLLRSCPRLHQELRLQLRAQVRIPFPPKPLAIRFHLTRLRVNFQKKEKKIILEGNWRSNSITVATACRVKRGIWSIWRSEIFVTFCDAWNNYLSCIEWNISFEILMN